MRIRNSNIITIVNFSNPTIKTRYISANDSFILIIESITITPI